MQFGKSACLVRCNPRWKLLQASFTGMLIILLAFTICPERVAGYSFLSHQNLIDVAWKQSILPVLRERFPSSTKAQLREARAYAYGGATIQDMGYYPFGHEFFSDLTHYVRAGDFVTNLLLNARTLDEYAFALGALAHYVGDNNGHEYATNLSTPVEFPKLEKKFGPVVTYDQAPHAHIRTEFAYDVDQLSHGRFAPPGYLHSVGFKVPRASLERAFVETYGVPLRSVLGRPRPAIKGYQSSVEHLLPRVAEAEVLIHPKDFPPDQNTPEFRAFLARQHQSDSENGWQKHGRKLDFQTHALAFLIRITPKIGPGSVLSIRGPNAKTERWYIASMNRSIAAYEKYLRELAKDPRKPLYLPNRDLDTGNPVRPGNYALTDQTYARLLGKLTHNPKRPIPASLKKNVLAYYSAPQAPISTKKNPKKWKRVQQELPILRHMQGIGSSDRHSTGAAI